MDEKEAIKKIIDEFFQNASEEDLKELQSLLVKRKQGNNLLDKMNFGKLAKNFSDGLRERMGLTTEQITRTARDAVRTMILQYDPNIPEREIDVLLDKWVPDRRKKAPGISGEIMRAMISQFVAYGRGELTDDQLKSFPEGWAKKYWANFPENIQRLIDAYIKDRINKKDFWNEIEKLLR